MDDSVVRTNGIYRPSAWEADLNELMALNEQES